MEKVNLNKKKSKYFVHMSLFIVRQYIFSPLLRVMMIIAPNSRTHKGKKERGEEKGEYEGVCGEEEGNVDYGGMMQPSQQHVAPRVKGVEWGLGTRYLRIVARRITRTTPRKTTRITRFREYIFLNI